MKVSAIIITVVGIILISNFIYKSNSPSTLRQDASVTVTKINDQVVEDVSESVHSTDVTKTPEPEQKEVLPEFNTKTLSLYNGTNIDLPIYIAFDGLVYDVTPGKKHYEKGAAYDFLSGTDGTKLLRVFGGDLIKEKYQVIGTFTP